jgi:hypothetical protein
VPTLPHWFLLLQRFSLNANRSEQDDTKADHPQPLHERHGSPTTASIFNPPMPASPSECQRRILEAAPPVTNEPLKII